MLKRLWFVLVVGWAALVIGLQGFSDPDVPAATWRTVFVIAALPFLLGKLVRFIAFGRQPRQPQSR